MKALKNLLILSVISLSLFSLQSCDSGPCSTKAKFEMSFNSLIEDYKAQDGKMKKEDVQAYIDEFNELFQNCYKQYKEEMSLAERQNFWKKSIVFITDGNLEMDSNSLSFNGDFNIDPEISAELEEVIKESGTKFVESISNLAKDELPKIIDRVVDEVERLGEEIKEALNNQ